MRKKTLIPNDFRDYLSIISIVGFVAITLEFAFNIDFLTNNLTTVFLIVGGLGIMSLSKLFTIKEWLRDGFQENETLQLLGGVIGSTMLFTGLMFIFKLDISDKLLGYIGIISIFPAVFIIADYISKNK